MARTLVSTLCALILIAPIAAAQTDSDNRFLPAGELAVTVGGMRVEGAQNWSVAYNIGYAHNIFHRENLPIVFELNESLQRTNDASTSSNAVFDFFGGGMRFGGASAGVFGSITGGFAKFSSVTTITYPDGTSDRFRSTFTRAAVSFTGGINLATDRSKWGVRAEIRGTNISGVQPWLYQIGGGILYRFGKP